jgi:hypothetical protein
MLVVLLLSAVSLGAEAHQFACWPIARGDTAYGLAVRLTGEPATLYTDWFQIRDPARGLFVPKSQYERLSTHWEACVARALVTRAAIAVAAVPPPPASRARYNMTIVWQVGVAVTLVLFACSIAARYVPDRAIPPDMRRTGEQFVAAFARPLIDPSSDAAPIRARLRFVRRAQQLEVCIAPNAGRRYPNLFDHKTNVEYDVRRVAQLIGTSVVVSDRLRAEGQWVVIPIRRADRKEAGAI